MLPISEDTTWTNLLAIMKQCRKDILHVQCTTCSGSIIFFPWLHTASVLSYYIPPSRSKIPRKGLALWDYYKYHFYCKDVLSIIGSPELPAVPLPPLGQQDLSNLWTGQWYKTSLQRAWMISCNRWELYYIQRIIGMTTVSIDSRREGWGVALNHLCMM